MRRRKDFLPFALPDTDDAEGCEILDAVRSGWVTTGPKTRLFESDFAKAVGARFAIAVNSCTAAMHLALESVGLQEGDEVITTPYTFAATAEVIRYFGAKPVFVDVRPSDLNIDPLQLEGAITKRTKAIIPVHFGGLAADLDMINRIADKRNLVVVEDAAHAFPTKYKGRMIGNISDFTCFSFYATKTITTGEGGMICTNNEAWADRCRIMSLHGISRDAWKRYSAEGTWYYEITAPGFKYNMTDIAAAMGIVQLRKAEKMRSRREGIAARYNAAFVNCAELQIPDSGSEGSQHAWHLYSLRLNLERLSENRDAIYKELKARNIGASVHFIPLHVHPYYRETYGYRPENFPVAYNEFLREISLPIYSKMSDIDVSDVISSVLDSVKKYRLKNASRN